MLALVVVWRDAVGTWDGLRRVDGDELCELTVPIASLRCDNRTVICIVRLTEGSRDPENDTLPRSQFLAQVDLVTWASLVELHARDRVSCFNHDGQSLAKVSD